MARRHISILLAAVFAMVLCLSFSFNVLGQTGCYPAPAGLIAWWAAEGDATDVQFGNNGVIEPGVAFGPGVVGQAFNFTPTANSYVDVPDNPSLRLTNVITIEFWAKRADLTNVQVIVEKGGDWTHGQTDYGAGLHLINNYMFYFYYNGGGLACAGIGDLNWHHYAVVATNGMSQAAFYIDGTSQPQASSFGSSTINMYPSTGDLYLGAQINGGAVAYSSGSSDEIAIYNQALSPQQIAAIYAAGSSGKCALPPAVSAISPLANGGVLGSTVTFSVVAYHTPPFGYQWFFDGTNLPAATNAALTIPNLTAGAAGSYTVVVTNAVGSVTSSPPATLTIIPPPSCEASGLVSWWPGEGNAAELTGANNGVVAGEVTFTNGIFGQAFNFYGTDSYIEVSSPSGLPMGNSPRTIELWFRSPQNFAANTDSALIQYGAEADGKIFGLITTRNAPGKIYFFGYNNDLAGITILQSNVWYHTAVTYDGATISLYLNGQLESSKTATLNTALDTNGLTIGFRPFTTNEWNGQMDEIAIYDRALSQSEINAIYLAGTNGKCFALTNISVTPPQSFTESATYTVSNFTAGVAGTPPFSYQWLLDGTNLPGANGSSLTFGALTANESGSYTVIVNNSSGSATSSPPAILTVNPALAITTLAGLANYAFTNDGTGSYARFSDPQGVAVDHAGNIYAADSINSTIRKITPAGVVTTLAGSPGSPGYVDNAGSMARFQNPVGVAVDANGYVYVAEDNQGSSRVRKITPGGVVSTLAAGVAEFLFGIAVDGGGNVYVSDTLSSVYKITSAGAVSVLAGSAAGFNGPRGLTVDQVGDVYVADSDFPDDFSATIYKITPGGVVSTIAGQAGLDGTNDGIGSAAHFSRPWGLAVDPAGNIYVSDAGNTIIRKITPTPTQNGAATNWVVTTVAGMAHQFGSADGVGSGARLSSPSGIAADANGNIYVADVNNDTIRKGSMAVAVVGQPQSQSVGVGGNASFSVSAIGGPPVAYQWFLNGVSLAGDTNATLTITNAHNAQAGNYTVAASNAGNSVTSAVATLTVVYPNGAPIDPALTSPIPNQTVTAGGNIFLNAVVSPNTTLPASYQWFFDGTNILAGDTNSYVNLANLLAPAAGSYTVVVSNGGGSYTSAPTILTVNMPLAITTIAGLYGAAPYSSDGVGIYGRFSNPQGVALDSSGNIYVADSANSTIRKMTPDGAVTTLAGLAGNPGYVDNVGNLARFQNPIGVAVDPSGNVYVAEENQDNSRVRKITPTGSVSTLATGLAEFLFGVAADGAGNVYVSDPYVGHIYRITSGGVVSLLAGGAGGLIDGIGGGAGFNSPRGLALDQAGNVYTTDGAAVRKITPEGMVSTIAGGLVNGTNDGVGSAAQFSSPWGVAMDTAGNVYVSDSGNNAIRKITPTPTPDGTATNWVVSTVAGGTPGGANGVGRAAQFSSPAGIAMDTNGNLYVADSGSDTIRKGVVAAFIVAQPQSQTVNVSNTVIFNVVATGGPPLGYQWFFNGLNMAGQTNTALSITNAHNAQSGSYTVIVSNAGNSVLSAPALLTVSYPLGAPVDPALSAPIPNQTVTAGSNVFLSATVTANSAPPYGFQWFFNGTNLLAGATNLSLNLPGVLAGASGSYSIVVSNAGGSYTSAPTVLTVNVPLTITTLAGVVNTAGTNDGTAGAALFNNPRAVAVDQTGNVYVADTGNFTIRKITPAAIVSTFAGLAGHSGYVDNAGSLARFQYPVGVAVDAAGYVYVTEEVQDNSRVRKITPQGVVSTLAPDVAEFLYGVAVDSATNVYVSDVSSTIYKITSGGTVSRLAGGMGGLVDGIGGGAGFYTPEGVAVDQTGNVYVADNGDYAIRKITPSGLVSTLAGGAAGSKDGIGSAAQFNSPWAVALDPAGNIYVLSQEDARMRKITPTPTPDGLMTNWVVSTVASGLFATPVGLATDTNGNVYVADANGPTIDKCGYYPSIMVPPPSRFVAIGGSPNLSASVIGTPPFSYQWQLNGSNIFGATNLDLVVSNCQYTNAGSYALVVTNFYGAATSAIAAVTILAAPSIATQPPNDIAAPGQTVVFPVAAAGDGVLSYQWSFNGANISGATNSTLSLPPVSVAQAGPYMVVVTNPVGSVTSTVATLTIEGTAITSANINSTWTLANSPYVANTNFSVADLVVQPGVTVFVNGPYSFTVTGSLQAAGTPGNPVIFDGGSWQGLRYVAAGSSNSLSWCVIRNATAGGIRLTNTPFAMTNCVIESNSGVCGGGVYSDSALWLQNCSLLGNQAAYQKLSSNYFVQGGGLYVTNGPVTLVSCLISNNEAVMPYLGPVIETSTGGGVDCEFGTLALNGCTVISNRAEGAGQSATALGGGAYASVNNNAALLTSVGGVFQGNSAAGGFGGAAAASRAAFLATSFSGNAATYGGALYTGGLGQTMATNCLLTGNSAVLGGAVYSTAPTAAGNLENCTVAYNDSDGINGFTGVIHDSILYFDGPNGETVSGSPTVLYCDIEGTNYAGAGNISADPLFADTNDFLLSGNSPCIDGGDPATQFDNEAFPPSQIEGGDQADMGCYGGPGAALWPAFADQAPLVLVNGQPAAPYQVLYFNAVAPPVITFSNGFPGGQYSYTLDGSNPNEYAPLTQIPLVLTNSAEIRVMSQPADQSETIIAAPLTVIVAPGYTLTASCAGGGGVYPTGGLYLSNTMAVLTATNLPGWTFLRWSGDAGGTNNPLSLIVSRTMSVQAVFGTPLAPITLSGKGIVQTNPALAYYPYGSTVQLMAIPTNTPATYFKDWNGAAVGNSYSPLDFVVTNPSPAITAVFGGVPNGFYSLNLVVAGAGDVSRNPLASDYAAGTTVALTAAPMGGYVFTGWSGGALGTNNPINVTMNSTMTVTATFASTAPPPALPPLIALTNPLAGAQFTLPANITLNAAASDPNTNGTILQVAFFAAGTNQLAAVTNAPFTFVWTNPPVGTNLLSAVALNNFGITATSAVVSVTASNASPGLPVFSCSQSAYAVLENGGSVTITVRKSPNSLGGSVEYATGNGSAAAANSQGVGNYYATSGSLVFAASDTSKTVSVPIIDNLIYVGDAAFNILLSPPGDGSSSVGSPGNATVTIIDVNQPSTTNSVLAGIFPSSLPPSSGQLEVVTQPPQGQWKLAWEAVWHNSGDILTGLQSGNYPVQFGPLTGFVPPAETTYPVTSGTLTVETNDYAGSGSPTYGSLTVTLDPPSIAAGPGLWQLQGATNWLASGSVIPGLLSGAYIIEFQEVLGWDSPAPMIVTVGANQENAVEATYLVAAQTGATPPSVLPFSAATTPEPGQPYVYNGELQTDVGYGSGCVVQPQVVLTAAHMVFDDRTLAYVNNAYWFFQEYSGIYNPPAQTPAGWYLFDGYAAARTNDLANGGSPGSESAASQNFDVAALYFFQPAGRGGSSGYLVSQSGGVEWLKSDRNMTLVGYPVDDVNQIDMGRMHATDPVPLDFSLVADNVFTTADIIGYGGNSGGPLCVEYTNNVYYPAGVYLGGSVNTIVRAIDGDVAGLINDANISASTGVNHGGNGGVPGGPTGGALLGVGTYQMVIKPPAAVSAGAGWKIVGQSGNYNTTTGKVSEPVASYTATFAPVSGFNPPANVTISVASGQNTIATVNYTMAVAASGPPLVAITNPVPGARVTLPANIVLKASASDTNGGGSVTQVTFAAGSTPLAVVTTAPFNYTWTNAPAGSNLLTAVALNNFGLSTTSAPVGILIVPPQPALRSPSFGNHTLQMTISGLAGESIAIDRSTNLTAWLPVSTNVVPSTGSTNFVDAILTNAPGAFYRARVVQ